MIRKLASDRSARPPALALMVVLCLACSRPASHPTQPVPSATGTTAERAQPGPVPADLRPGTRIRYSTRSYWAGLRTGEVARASADTVWVERNLWRFEGGRALPVASLRRLEYSPAGNTKIRKIVWGTLIGGAVGAAVGASVPPKECDRCAPGASYPADQGFNPLLVGVYGAITGGLGTALIAKDEKWVKVELPRAER